jgi:hypothetical protein
MATSGRSIGPPVTGCPLDLCCILEAPPTGFIGASPTSRRGWTLKANATDGLAALGGSSDQPPQARDRDLDPDEEALVLATLDAFGVHR